jgi:hypothetical protein
VTRLRLFDRLKAFFCDRHKSGVIVIPSVTGSKNPRLTFNDVFFNDVLMIPLFNDVFMIPLFNDVFNDVFIPKTSLKKSDDFSRA